MLRKYRFALKPAKESNWQAVEIEATIDFLTKFKAWLFDLVSTDRITFEQSKRLLTILDLIAACDEADLTLLGGTKLQYRCIEVTE